jgi:hypothetical protein
VLRSILERLERFQVVRTKPAPFTIKYDLTRKLLGIFNASNNPMNIQHIFLEFGVFELNSVLRCLPKLVSLEMPIKFRDLKDPTLNFFECQNLKSITGLRIGRTDWLAFGVKWLASENSATIGLNLSFDPDSEAQIEAYLGEKIPLLRLMYRGFEGGLANFFKLEAFKPLQNPIEASHFVEVLIEGTFQDANQILPLLELAVSESAPPWFPRRDRLLEMLRTSASPLWDRIAIRLPLEAIASIARLVGLPEEINAPEALRWLLEHLGDDEAELS